MKKYIVIAIALVCAYFAVNILWWVVTSIFTLVFNIAALAIMVVIAIPIYFIIMKKLN